MFNFEGFFHGGDYNPEQWLHDPDVLRTDLERMRQAHINVVSLGMFSWSMLEPEEGVFQFGWLEDVIQKLYENGVSVFLSTPSGARPKWLADKYPEVLRVDQTGRRAFFGARHNHCYTSPVYSEKVRVINQELARRLGNHPAVKLWHLSNEYGGECHCPLCQAEFRRWLERKYESIDELNLRWSTTFWSHRYNSFDQIEAPSTRGESLLHALNLDWRRFVTERTTDFMKFEIRTLRDAGSDKPVTTNLMTYFNDLDYFKLAPHLDVISYDAYPEWYSVQESLTAEEFGMQYDTMRSLKHQNWLLMESCPSSTNWQAVSKLKKPGLLHAASLQAIAHGSDSVQYFQIRQSQGSSEKFHGAVIDHYGGSDSRVFREVAKTGAALRALKELCGSATKAQAALIFDWENRWAMEDAQGPRNIGLHYKETQDKCYRALRRRGLNVDVIDQDQSLEGYKIVAVPMMYLFKPGFSGKLRGFVENGGTVLMTYWSGIVDETDRCFMGGTPHDLMDVFGLRSAEIDGLYDGQFNEVVPAEGQDLIRHTYRCENLCELLEIPRAKSVTELGDTLSFGCREEQETADALKRQRETEGGAEVLAVYGRDFYAGTPALTRNAFGKGQAYYIAADLEQGFYDELYASVIRESGVELPPVKDIPQGMHVTQRQSDDAAYLIIQNFGEETVPVSLTDPGYEKFYGADAAELKQYETLVFRKALR